MSINKVFIFKLTIEDYSKDYFWLIRSKFVSLSLINSVAIFLGHPVGFEINMKLNSTRKHEKYMALVDNVVYANNSMGAFGSIEKDSKTFLNIMTKLNIPETEIQHLTKSIINICIRTSCFIFVAEIKNGPNTHFHPFKQCFL